MVLLGALNLDLAQLQHDLLRARPLTSPHVRLLRSWLILSINPVQSQPVRSLASVPDHSLFKSGRQFAAWLGLVPRQHSSGGRERMLGISKRGNVYLRALLIHGARSITTHPGSCPTRLHQWVEQSRGRRYANIAVVALANKMARIVWTVMARDEPYAPAQ